MGCFQSLLKNTFTPELGGLGAGLGLQELEPVGKVFLHFSGGVWELLELCQWLVFL